MKIRTKLKLSFLIGALPIIIAGAIVYYNLRLISKSFDNVANDVTPAILFLNDIKTAFLDGANNTLAYTISEDTQKKTNYENDMQAFQNQKGRLTALVTSGASVAPTKDLELLAKINSAHEDFTQAAQALFALSHDEKDGIAGVDATNVFTEKINGFLDSIDTFISMERLEVAATQNEVYQDINQTLRVTIILTVFALLLSLWANGWIFKSISRPLSVFKDKVRAIASGFSEAKVEILSQDEFGELAKAFNEMTKKSYDSQIELQKKIEKEEKKLEMAEIKSEAKIISCENKI